MTPAYHFKPIGFIESPCKEKFGVPRQANLVPELLARVNILPEYSRAEAFTQLDTFSHVWLIGIFHQALREEWQPTVRPPRLGGNARVGVFASRAPFRPNPIAMSAVQLIRIEQCTEHVCLHIAGCDLVDGTPVLDIKPYLPYADALPQASAGYTRDLAKPNLAVEFSPAALLVLQEYVAHQPGELQALITRLIQQDPRPAYAEDTQDRHYAFRLYDFDVVFRVAAGLATVEKLQRI